MTARVRWEMKARFGWLSGLLVPWVALWALLGTLSILALRHRPHPFLPSQKLTGIVLRAVVEWSLQALVAHLVLCLVAGLILLLTVTPWRKDDPPMQGLGFGSGLLAGAGTLLWFHGIAYAQVPLALDHVPGLNQLPMGITLAAFLGGGFWLVLRALGRHQPRWTWARAGLSVALLSGLQQLPHDLFRRASAPSSVLAPEAARLFILSFDGMSRGAFDAGMPEWKMADGTLGVCASPATRIAWELLLGADPAMVPRASMMPYESEILRPDRLSLLKRAKELGLRTAFMIDDASTPCFALSPTHFTTVREPYGGWKYFLTLVGSTTWPAHSFAQNFYQPVETSNPWFSLDAYWRDAGRLLEGHHWVSTHQCGLHWPIILTRQELVEFQGWRWLLHRPSSYRPLQGSLEQSLTKELPSRLADPLDHYLIRTRRLLRSVQPWIRDWERSYPALSGVLTADHGEYHLPIEDKSGKVANHFAGMHGFGLQPEAISIPIHGFGTTKLDWTPPGPLSWYELRDGIQHWLKAPEQGLQVAARAEGLLMVFPAIRGVHLPGKDQLPLAGETPADIRNRVILTWGGLWFTRDPKADPEDHAIMAYAFLERDQISTFNPLDRETFLPTITTASERQPFKAISRTDLLAQLKPINHLRPQALKP